MRSPTGDRIIAVYEAAKGALVLAAGFGLLSLLHRDAEAAAESLLEHFHLDPAARYPRIFLHAASALTDTRLWLLAAGAFLYALVRFVEAYGLWRARRWAEWFAAVSGAVYVPIEIYELARGVTWEKVVVLLLNLVIVVYMGRRVLPSRRG